ncbi:glycosyltransferase family 4 protein [Methylopila sp. Yamaguchi]|uniref:glycosyltransferase family 4 protein n=1 Tax=Methylopila sp. Yamaguchi TaxID=1437817 RepID=UPI000CC65FE4|nr:glycosyltransferase family 4 protein [Methylopila sp. Yamaguchi]GBD49589.1 group 1 glycosyl transferase [Methylopila sp. Yamaguchi]
MRIAQIAPLAESVPPLLYGGTERVVSWLTEELVRQGHEVTLFASGDSKTSARLCPLCPKALRLAGVEDHLASHLVLLDQVRRLADDFDLLHFHTDLIQFPLFQDVASKTVTTLHGRVDLPDCHPVYRAFPQLPLVSISQSQRLSMPIGANVAATIHHGLPPDLIPLNPRGGDHLVFLGRMSPEKRPDRAIEIAKRAGVPLKIAAKISVANRSYFNECIKPLMDHPLIEFVGEIGDQEKPRFLGEALAVLFPIDWCEPFGLVMIEAMAAGTPVIAWPTGSVPEVVADGVSGFLVSSVEEAVSAVHKASALSRQAVRGHFEAGFTVQQMAARYCRLYDALLARGRPIRIDARAGGISVPPHAAGGRRENRIPPFEIESRYSLPASGCAR